MHIDLFDARVLEPLVNFLEFHGLRSESLLNRACIPSELVAEGGWITKKQAYEFTYDVVRRTRCQEAVFAAYLNFKLDQLGPIAQAMRSCKTVKESLEVGTRMGRTAYEGSDYFLRIDGDTTWFCYCEPDVISAGQTFINDMTLTIFYQLIRILADENWRPRRMLVRKDEIARHRSMECFEACQVNVHGDFSALAFPTEFLSRRLPRQLRADNADDRDSWRCSPEGSEPIVDSLYRLLTSRFRYDRPPTLERVAQITGFSTATLKRQLASVGLTYRGLLDRLRFDAACEMLSMPEFSVKEIAHELYYSDTSNFVRSFRRMTNMSPVHYRRSLVEDDTNGSSTSGQSCKQRRTRACLTVKE